MAEIFIPTLKQTVMITVFVLLMMVVIEHINLQSKNVWSNKLQQSLIDKILTIRNKDFLVALDNLISSSTAGTNVVKLTAEQREMLEISKEESDFIIEEIFLTEEAGSKMHPAVLFEDHLYLNHSGRPNRMICLSLEGEVLWDSDSIGFEMGGLILVDGMIINQNGKDGEITLIEPSPKGYREVGRASFFSSKKSLAWAPLAFSQGKLVIRDLEKLVCVDIQNP